MRTEAIVGHLDADCFYVSAERVRNRFLIGKPVGVLGNQGACVIAKSYEMKARGVKTGEPIWEAHPKCPQGIYVKRDFRWYEVLSRLMFDHVREFSPKVEYYSIDEFFFTAVPLPGKSLQQTAEAIRDRIWRHVRVPVTVGIARTKTIAKLISDSAKPFGAKAILDGEPVTALLAGQPVTEIAGISGRRERRLLPWGIRTCLDLARADRRLVRELLTATGEALWWELNGDPVLPLHPERPLHKVLSRGGSFGEPAAAPAVLWAWLVRNLERLIEELEYHEVCTGKLTVWVPRVAAERMHLFAERLVPKGKAQLGLFEPEGVRADAVAHLKREVNERHGRFILRSGATLPLPAIYRDPANQYDICDVRGKMCF
jgi:nucleotidyltransferase/DNA polymerase involved in DNA repair